MSDAALERIVERVQKLLALGRRGGTEAEAASAMAKAQELLAAHNLDMAAVEGQVAGSARREKSAQNGGMYVYQRHLWSEVARLNFCLHFRRHLLEPDGGANARKRWKNKHMIVGRTVNVRATIAMGEYLEAVIDRLCRERLQTRSGAGVTPGELNSQFFTSWAVAFREGVADRVVDKVQERRQQHLREENKKKRAAAFNAAGASTSTAIALSTYVDAETDANVDFMYGEGTSADWAASRAARAAADEAADRAHAEWAAAHPEEAAAEERKRAARARRRTGRRAPAERRVDAGGYWAGVEAGEGVGIDPQASAEGRRMLK
jgi:hypothetical protein